MLLSYFTSACLHNLPQDSQVSFTQLYVLISGHIYVIPSETEIFEPDCQTSVFGDFMGGLCSQDNHCNLDHGRGNSSSPGVQCGCHRNPCLTDLHLKGPCTVSDCPLPPVYCLSGPLSPRHTHKCTRARKHTTFIHPSHNSVLTNCLPRPPLFPAHSGKMTCVWWPKSLHCLLSLSPQRQAHHDLRVGGGRLSEWHVCTAQRLQKRFNVADMLFCLLLCASLLISSTDKQWDCTPSKPLQLIRNAEEPEMKRGMTLTSKCQLVLHFLLFTLTFPRNGVHDHAQGYLHIWTLLFVYISYGRN